jgi:hypothetical protein
MSADLSVNGAAALAAFAARCKAAGDERLMAGVRKGIVHAVAPLAAAVRAEIPHTMPSGYTPTLAAAVRTRTTTRTSGGSATVTLTLWAEGKSRRRRVVALNRGQLRHPLFGNRKRWYVTRVTPGFWSRPIAAGKRDAVRATATALDEVAADIAKGS